MNVEPSQPSSDVLAADPDQLCRLSLAAEEVPEIDAGFIERFGDHGAIVVQLLTG